mmetsp:Transcript_33007/g.66686  ORF Transcript_33007/g.66686 Transcript_33007/m.66686 type:complete len:213 (+) Transcript_33007:227-865(+)
MRRPGRLQMHAMLSRATKLPPCEGPCQKPQVALRINERGKHSRRGGRLGSKTAPLQGSLRYSRPKARATAFADEVAVVSSHVLDSQWHLYTFSRSKASSSESPPYTLTFLATLPSGTQNDEAGACMGAVWSFLPLASQGEVRSPMPPALQTDALQQALLGDHSGQSSGRWGCVAIVAQDVKLQTACANNRGSGGLAKWKLQLSAEAEEGVLA